LSAIWVGFMFLFNTPVPGQKLLVVSIDVLCYSPAAAF
jgi:hypothetical protein